MLRCFGVNIYDYIIQFTFLDTLIQFKYAQNRSVNPLCSIYLRFDFETAFLAINVFVIKETNSYSKTKILWSLASDI